MRTLRNFIILFSVVIFVSCKSKNKTPESPTVQTGNVHFVTPPITEEGEQVPTDNTKSENVRLQISFYSIGAGIDNANKEKFDGWLLNQPKKVKYDEAHWGREGEVDYCFTLSELNSKEQEKFVSDSKTMLSKSNLVHIDENVPCAHKK